MTEPGVYRAIGSKSYPSLFRWCDICGWSTDGPYIDIMVGDRSMDFCHRHTPEVINGYIELGLDWRMNDQRPQENVKKLNRIILKMVKDSVS